MSNTYLDNLMQNNFLNKYSSDEIMTESSERKKHVGGFSEDKLKKFPTGGFPPIYKCIREEIIKEEEKKDREFATKITAVSIKEIMQQLRDETTFTL